LARWRRRWRRLAKLRRPERARVEANGGASWPVTQEELPLCHARMCTCTGEWRLNCACVVCEKSEEV
jgi:hypothetical protein